MVFRRWLVEQLISSFQLEKVESERKYSWFLLIPAACVPSGKDMITYLECDLLQIYKLTFKFYSKQNRVTKALTINKPCRVSGIWTFALSSCQSEMSHSGSTDFHNTDVKFSPHPADITKWTSVKKTFIPHKWSHARHNHNNKPLQTTLLILGLLGLHHFDTNKEWVEALCVKTSYPDHGRPISKKNSKICFA